jgi:hypothetical protein
VQQAVLDDGGERLLLDGGRPELDALQHARVQDVDAGVDAVTHELDGLLDKAVNLGRGAGLVDDNTILGRLLDLCDDDGALVTVLLVELGELLEGVVAGDIGVEDEEGGLVLAQNALGELQGAGRAEGFGFDREGDGDVVLFFVLHKRLVVVVVVVVVRARLAWVGGGGREEEEEEEEGY